jgi:hypothetical protein
MPSCTPVDFYAGILTYVLPPLGALLSAIALLVASRARSISADAQSMSLGRLDRSGTLPRRLERRRTGLEAGEPRK